VASKSITVVIDDLTGKELPEGAHETVNFSLDGVRYELDVSPTGAQKLRAALEPYVKAGRRLVSGRTTRRTRSESNAATIRAWAAANGIEVSARGRISSDVKARFEAANG
jgi:nucleoid-associated protein Lsr2